MTRSVKHGLPNVDRVRAAMDAAYLAHVDRLAPVSPKMVWTSPHTARMTATVMTRTITADFTITNEEVLVETKVPFLLSHLDGRIMQGLSEHLEASFSNASRKDRAPVSGPSL